MSWLAKIIPWIATEYFKEYQASRIRIFDMTVRSNAHLNTIMLTVSVASLTAIAALNDRVFANYPWLSFIVVALFILVVLFSTINFFISGLVLGDIQKRFNKDILFPFRISESNFKPKFKTTQRLLNMIVLGCFCLGLIALLVLLGVYILGARR